MQFEISALATASWPPIGEIAVEVDRREFDSLWVGEHPHLPLASGARHPFAPGGAIPSIYAEMQDPFVALSQAAALTSRLRLGIGVCLIPEREPIVTAKQVATLDVLSGGRFLFGVGAGWNAAEMAAFGVSYADRWRVSEDRVRAMQRIWQDDVVEYHGPYVEIAPTRINPKPVQKPHPPILIGADGPRGRQRAVEWADGVLPIRAKPERIAEGIRDLRGRAIRAGRDPESLLTIVYGYADATAVSAYERAGVDTGIFVLQAEDTREKLLVSLERLAKLATVGRG